MFHIFGQSFLFIRIIFISTLSIMANKRSLKHCINLVCEELFAECVAATVYGHSNHQDNAEDLLHTIIRIQADYTSRVSHPEPGIPARVYYSKLRESFSEQVNEVLDHIANL